MIAGRDLVEVLPSSHSLPGCDSASKVATKGKALRVAQTSKDHNLLYRFGRDKISEEMREGAEKFLLLCFTKHNVRFPPEWTTTFFDVCYTVEQ